MLKRSLLLAATALIAVAASAPAVAATATFGVYNFDYGGLGNPVPYGTVTVTDEGGGVAKVVESVAPNFILNTGNDGNKLPLTFNLAGAGTIDPNSVTVPYSIAVISPVDNPPFGAFADGIDGACGSGASSGGCGSSLTFNILNFEGFLSNMFTLDNQTIAIFFASDIINVATGQTGDVGAGSPLSAVPLPAALPLFISGLIGIGLIGKRRKAKTLPADAAAA